MKRFFTTCALVSSAILAAGTSLSQPDIQIVLLGDYLPGVSASPVIGKYGYDYLFDGISEIMAGADLTFLNLETPLSTRGRPQTDKKYVFRTDPAAASAMATAGIDVVSLANNHIMDYGPEALSDTIRHLDAAGIVWTGAGSNLAEAARPAGLDVGSTKISFLAFSNTFPRSYWARKNRPGTHFGSGKAVSKASRAASGSGPLIVSFHWGAELTGEPKEYQVRLAHQAVDAGADIVVGHHPHIPQPIEIYRGKAILYSLGNFSFGSYSKNTRVGLAAKAHLGSDGTLTALEVFPVKVDNAIVAFRPVPISGPDGEELFKKLTAGIPRSAASTSWDGRRGVIVPTAAGQTQGDPTPTGPEPAKEAK